MNKQRFTKIFMLFAFLLTWLGTTNVKGQLLTEAFEYGATADSLSFVSGVNWNGHSGTTNYIQYVPASSLSFGSYPTAGGKATFTTTGQDINRANFTATSTGTVYVSFLVNLASTQATGDYFFNLGATTIGTNFVARVSAKTKSTGFELGIAKGGTSGTTAVYGASSPIYAYNTTYYVVVKYDFGASAMIDDDVATLFSFDTSVPTTEPGTPYVTTSVGTGAGLSIGSIAIRQGNSANAPAGSIDYIRVGTTWTSVTSLPATATITASPTSISGFSSILSTASNEQNYTVGGTTLTGDITITAPTDYEISLTSGSGYTNTLTLTPTSGTVATTTIFVRIKSSASAGSPSGNISHTSAGATAVNVAVSGTVNTPTIAVTPTSLSGFSTNSGTASASQTYSVSGTNLLGNITLTAPTDYEISLTSGSGYAGTLALTPTSNTVSATTIFVRIKSTAGIGSPSGNVTNASSNATTQNVAVSGTVTATPVPTVSVTPASLSGFTATSGTASASQSYTVSGVNLLADITITAPTDYEISLTSGSGYATTLTLTPTSGTVATTTIFVRIKSTAGVGSPSGNVTNVAGVASKDVAVSGTVTTPTLTASVASLSTFSTVAGTASASQSYTISGANLTTDVTVTAPTDYEVSLTSGSGYAGTLTLTPTSGTVATTTIFVRIKSTAGVGSPSGNVTNVSSTASKSVAVSGTVSVPPPTVTATPTSLTGFLVTTGTASASQSYTVSGTNLLANITVTAPTDYEISLTSGSGYANTLTLTQTAGTVSSTTVFARIKSTAGVGSPSGSITNVSGTASQSVTVSGTVNPLTVVTTIAPIRNAVDANLAQIAPFANGTPVNISGNIYGVNRNIDAVTANGTKQKFEFTILDNSVGRNGIVIRSTGTTDIAPIDLKEGDSLNVIGTVSQFNGLSQITATSVTRLATGRTKKAPIATTLIAENEESQYINLSNATVTTWPATWTGTGQNITITAGANTYTLRITVASELWNKTLTDVFGAAAVLPVANVGLIGLGGQFDSSSPFNAGYQMFVNKLADVVLPSTLSVTPTSLSGFSTTVGTASPVKTYSVVGSLLASNVVITAPAGYEVSNGSGYASTQTLVPVAREVNTTISVRLSAVAAVGVYSGTISNVSGSLSQNVSVFGLVTSLSGATPIKIADTKPSNGNGVSLLDGVTVSTTGTVYGVNTNASSSFPAKVQFTMIDGSPRAGIQVRYDLSTPSLGYVVTEGDVVTVVGLLGNYQGMTTLTPTSITKTSGGATLLSPIKLTSFVKESNESDLISIDSLTVVSGWGVLEPGKDYWRVTVTNNKGVDYSVRVDNDTDIFGKPQPTTQFNLIGIGMQDDDTVPFAENYQIAPRRYADLQFLSSLTATENDIAKQVTLYPNPASSYILIQGLPEGFKTELLNATGELVDVIGTDSIQVQSLAKGMYLVRFSKGTKQFAKRIVVE